jgi:adenylate cyclase
MDWDGEGLLDGLEDEDSRRGRIELLEYLHDEGCAVDELKQAVEEDRLVLLPLERVLAGEVTQSQRDIADASGLDLERLIEFRQALGLAIPDPEAKVFSEQDAEAAELAAELQRAGFPIEDTIEVARVLGRGMARYAEALRVLFAQTHL